MIRIRYKDLSPGLHGKAERSARGTTVYLLPGLTGGQRRAALRRLRQEASRGCGPALPGPDLAAALAADRFRVGARHTAAVVRRHPAGSLLPALLAGALMTLFVLASVSARMAQPPQAAPRPGSPSAGGAPTVVGTPVLAMGTPPAGQGSGSQGASGSASADGDGTTGGPGSPGGGQGNIAWSLAASSGQGAAGQGGGQAGTPEARSACEPAGASPPAGTHRIPACHKPPASGQSHPWSRPTRRPARPPRPAPPGAPAGAGLAQARR